MATEASSFTLEVEGTTLSCAVGQRYAAEQIREGRIPVLSCEGPCIRGEIARQAAHRVAREEPFARACQGEAMAVPESEMARWVREADQVVVLDGCFLRCQARMMRRMLSPDQLIEIDALALYKRYTDKYAIDEVPEAERNAVAEDVADMVLAKLAGVVGVSSNDEVGPARPQVNAEPGGRPPRVVDRVRACHGPDDGRDVESVVTKGHADTARPAERAASRP